MSVDMHFGPGDDADLWAAFGKIEQAGWSVSGVTVEQWERLPESICRDHELDRGRLVSRESGSPGHQIAARRLANAIEGWSRRAVASGAFPCLAVNQDLDVRLWEVPSSTVRRPDVLAYQCLKPGGRLWAADVVLAVEIVSPTSEADDTGLDSPRTGFESKKTQYARAGIKTYWTVRLRKDDSAIHRIEEWRLVDDLGTYRPVAETVNGLDEYAIDSSQPFDIRIPFGDLEF
jgi:Uma2 family endonuclease